MKNECVKAAVGECERLGFLRYEVQAGGKHTKLVLLGNTGRRIVTISNTPRASGTKIVCADVRRALRELGHAF